MVFRVRSNEAELARAIRARRKLAVPRGRQGAFSDAEGAGATSFDPITDAQRASAARIRITYDKKRGHSTESWIRNLARQA